MGCSNSIINEKQLLFGCNILEYVSFEFILSCRWSLGSCRSLHWMNGISLDPISLCVSSMKLIIFWVC